MSDSLSKVEIAAYVKDRLRLVDRSLLFIYMAFLQFTSTWFMGLTEPTQQHAAIAAIATAAAGPLLGFYNTNGRATLEFLDKLMLTRGEDNTVSLVNLVAYLLDRFRVFPTLFLAWFTYHVFEVVVLWSMMGLENPTSSQAVYAAAVAGIAPTVFGFFGMSKDVSNDSMKRLFSKPLFSKGGGSE